MSFVQKLKVKSDSLEVFASAGTIGLHMVSGPIVGFGIGYGLDFWLDTGPWMKLVFLVVGILAGFLNVYRDTQMLLKKMNKPKDKRTTSSNEDVSSEYPPLDSVHKNNKED